MSANIFSLLRGAGGEAGKLGRLAKWRQAVSKALDQIVVQVNSSWLSPASGVTVGSNPLAMYITNGLKTGATVYVQNIQAYFAFDAASTATPDQITTVQALGTGRFVRLNVPSPEYQVQTSWFIDPTNGFDENLGSTSGAAIKTWAELSRRVGTVWTMASVITVTLLGNLPSSDPMDQLLRFSTGGQLRINGTATATYSGTVGLVTAINRATNTPYDYTDATLGAGHVNARMRMTSGTHNNYIAWLMKDLTGGRYRVTPWTFLNTAAATTNSIPDAQGAVAPGDTYVLETLTTVAKMHLRCLAQDASAAPSNGNVPILLTNILYTGGTSGGVPISGIGELGDLTPVWYGCDMVSSQLQGTSIASHHAATTYSSAGPAFISYCGSGLLGGTSVQTGNMVFLDFDTLVQGGGGFGFRIREGGTARIGSLGVFDAGTVGVVVEDGSARSLNFLAGVDATYGAGNGTFGIQVTTLGKWAYTTKPTLTGGTNDTTIGGTATAYAGIPFVNATNLAQLSVFA